MASASDFNTITLDGKTQTVSNYEAAQQALKAASKDSNSSLGKDAFLQLLVTQMRYQDPLNPADSMEYMSQLAQFSSLEQMTNLNETMTTLSESVNGINSAMALQQYSTLIGTTVAWNQAVPNGDGTSTTISLTGNVKGVKIVNKVPQLLVESNNKTYTVQTSDVTQIMK